MGWVIFAVYLLAGLLLTRPIYGRTRAVFIDDRAKTDSDPVAAYNRADTHAAMILTITFSMAWPVWAVIFYCGPLAVRYVRGAKHKSRYELAQQAQEKDRELEKVQNKIKELEMWESAWRLGEHGKP